MPPWCYFHLNHKRMVYGIVEIYRINSLVIVLPMVMEPQCPRLPQGRGLLTAKFVSGGKKSKFPSPCACTFCFVAEISCKSLSVRWAEWVRRLPSPLCQLCPLPQGLESHSVHFRSQRHWWLVALSYLFIFFKEWGENRAPLCLWQEAFGVCLCLSV